MPIEKLRRYDAKPLAGEVERARFVSGTDDVRNGTAGPGVHLLFRPFLELLSSNGHVVKYQARSSARSPFFFSIGRKTVRQQLLPWPPWFNCPDVAMLNQRDKKSLFRPCGLPSRTLNIGRKYFCQARMENILASSLLVPHVVPKQQSQRNGRSALFKEELPPEIAYDTTRGAAPPRVTDGRERLSRPHKQSERVDAEEPPRPFRGVHGAARGLR